MRKTSNISRNFLKDKQYEVMVLDVNSLFLFGGKNSIKNLYSFIDSIKKSIGNENLKVINVIDNGLNSRLLRKFPYYKQNRHHSIQSNSIDINKFGSVNSFKQKISRIHKVDELIKNHLPFYLTGESDFKIGYILKFLRQMTPLKKEQILTVSLDKDLILGTVLSDVLLKRVLDKKKYQCLLDDDANIGEFKEVLNIEQINMKNIFDFFYYLLLNGDSIDNIKTLLTKAVAIKFMNFLYSKYDKIDINLICDHIREYNPDITDIDVLNNGYLIDIFNEDVFTTNQKHNMHYVLQEFLMKNNIEVFK